MSEDIMINHTPMETRVAIVENGSLQEIFIERKSDRGRVGSIFKGKVARVLPGMQAAFVDIGLERSAFIHASDIYRSKQSRSEVDHVERFEKVLNERHKLVRAENIEHTNHHKISNHSHASHRDVPPIQTLVHEGQEIVVQIVKDQIGTKGARLTTELSIPSRYLVLLPNAHKIGISQRIEEISERDRLTSILEDCSNRLKTKYNLKDFGVIARTVADGVSEEELCFDLEFLLKVWRTVTTKTFNVRAISTIHEDLPLMLRTVRDLVRPKIDKVRIDDVAIFEMIKDFTQEYMPDLVDKIDHYKGERPIFDLYGVEDELKKSLDRTVSLKSGGYLIVDQTEAMTTFDVNTGGYVGHKNLEETIFKTNLEAAHAIVRQLRLRNLGGIIIIDFIDMSDNEHKRQVLRAFEKVLERDHAKTNITQVSDLGLIEMTRKRTRESLERTLCETCPTCEGRGFVKTTQTVCFEIYREILRESKVYNANEYLVVANPDVVDRLLDEESDHVTQLENVIKKRIKFQVEALYGRDNYDIVMI